MNSAGLVITATTVARFARRRHDAASARRSSADGGPRCGRFVVGHRSLRVPSRGAFHTCFGASNGAARRGGNAATVARRAPRPPFRRAAARGARSAGRALRCLGAEAQHLSRRRRLRLRRADRPARPLRHDAREAQDRDRRAEALPQGRGPADRAVRRAGAELRQRGLELRRQPAAGAEALPTRRARPARDRPLEPARLPEDPAPRRARSVRAPGHPRLRAEDRPAPVVLRHARLRRRSRRDPRRIRREEGRGDGRELRHVGRARSTRAPIRRTPTG